MDPYNTRIISKLLFYGQEIVKINDMRHFIIEKVFSYKMASKMAAKIVHLNESNPNYIHVIMNCTQGHKHGKLNHIQP